MRFNSFIEHYFDLIGSVYVALIPSVIATLREEFLVILYRIKVG